MKCALILLLCLGVALARPSFSDNDILKLVEEKPAKGDDTKHPVVDTIQLDDKDKDPKDKDPKDKDSGIPWLEDLAKVVKIQFTSMGRAVNNPAVESGVNGETYHKLGFKWGKEREYNIYLDHLLDEFKSGDGGTMSLGYSGPLPFVGDVAVRGGQSFNSAGNGTFEWRVDLSDDDSTNEWH